MTNNKSTTYSKAEKDYREMVVAYNEALEDIKQQLERLDTGICRLRWTNKTWATVGTLQHTAAMIQDLADGLLGEGEYASAGPVGGLS